MFEHVTVPQIAELQGRVKSKTQEGKRVYMIDGKEKAYPSITTVLGYFGKQAIMEWRKRVGEEEANRISRQAATKGTRVHSLVEDYINNREVGIKDEMFHIQIAFKGIQSVLDNRLTAVYAQESALYSDYLKVAGRVDCVGIFDGKLSIIDFKTSRRVKDREDISNYFMQEAAYAIMFEEITKMPVTRLVTIMAVDGIAEPLIFVERRDAWAPELVKTIKRYYINNN